MIRTPICDLLGIEYPIFQGGMAWVADASLASAVSNGGGLGLIAAMNSNGEQLREEIRKCREMTDKPFGVNIMLMSPFVEETAKVVIEEKVPVITTGAGNPSRYMEDWLAAGIKVIPVVPSTGVARMVEKHGAAAVIAEGGESGGHIGELTTMALVPQVCDAVSIPVLAAGGIADGRGIAASFMLGAVGVQVGTRFLVANECTISQVYKDKVLTEEPLLQGVRQAGIRHLRHRRGAGEDGPGGPSPGCPRGRRQGRHLPGGPGGFHGEEGAACR